MGQSDRTLDCFLSQHSLHGRMQTESRSIFDDLRFPGKSNELWWAAREIKRTQFRGKYGKRNAKNFSFPKTSKKKLFALFPIPDRIIFRREMVLPVFLKGKLAQGEKYPRKKDTEEGTNLFLCSMHGMDAASLSEEGSPHGPKTSSTHESPRLHPLPLLLLLRLR